MKNFYDFIKQINHSTKNIFNSIFIVTAFLVLSADTHAQSISINNDGSDPNSKAMLDIQSNMKGLLIPRMTEGQRTGMGLGFGDLGMMVYDTDAKNFMFYTGADWVPVGEGASLWETYSSFGLRAKDNRTLGIGTFPASTTKVRIEAAAQKGMHISNNGATDNYALKVENEVGTAAFFGSGASSFSGYPTVPAAINARGSGDNNGIQVTSYGTGAGLLTINQGTGPAIDAYSFGTGLAGLFRNGNVAISGGNLGIGITNPTNRLRVEGETSSTAAIVSSRNNYSGNSDVRAIEGISIPADGYGYGGYFQGGYRGVYGVNSGGAYDGLTIGVYGNSTGTGVGTRVGIYGSASGGTTNWAGYFTGNTFCSGDLRIGYINGASGYRLSVDGRIMAEEIRVENSLTWPDYVFAEDYHLKSLEEVEAFISAKSHLPGIPSAAEVEENGISLGDMQRRSIEKIEELTLHLIQMNKEMKALQNELNLLKKDAK